MTAQITRAYADFAQGFAMAYAEEISGETYFAALATSEKDRARAGLWAKLALVEQRTHQALHPFVAALGLLPADPGALARAGQNEARDWQDLPWHDIMTLIQRDYPAYVREFEAIRAMAPPHLVPAAQLLIDHEWAIIRFAEAELAGAANPADALDAYLAHLDQWHLAAGRV